jgi:uncharacterized protein
MLRASSYNIYVDLPGNEEGMLLVHGYTGAYDKVSKQVGDYVRSLQVGRRHKPLYGEWESNSSSRKGIYTPSEQTISILKKRGYLIEKDPEEEEKIFIRIAKALHAVNTSPGYVFMPTYNCNLRCPYCFQDHMRTDPAYSHLLRTMTIEMVDRIFSAMIKIEASHGLEPGEKRTRSIGFFGGEPFLKESRPIVERIVNKALSMGDVSFYGISNATELHHYKEVLGPGKVSFLQITLDGPPHEHNKRRIYADGSGSFDIIASNISMAMELGVMVNIRMNIDRNNINQLPELADEIVNRGWDKAKNFWAYTAPVHPANEKTKASTTFNSWELDQAVSKLREIHPNMEVIARPDDGMKDKARRLFSNSGSPSLRSSFCGAHNGMYIFDVFGDIYACWELAGDKKTRIGSISPSRREMPVWNIGKPSPTVIEVEGDYALEQDVFDMWRSRNVTTNPTCLKCRYALHCGGGCAVFAERKTGTIFTNFCDAYGKRFNAMVGEAYIEHANGMVFEEKLNRVCDL